MSEAAAGRPARPSRWPAVLAWVLCALTLLGIPALPWLDHLTRRAGHPELLLVSQDATNYLFVLPAVVSAATVGAVLATRRPRHPVGWLLLVLAVSAVTAYLGAGYMAYELARPGAVPGAVYMDVLFGSNWIIWPACVGLILLLTPTGVLPSPRWRWWVRAVVAMLVAYYLISRLGTETIQDDLMGYSFLNPLFVEGMAPLRVAETPLIIATQLGAVVGAASLVVRFRRARGVERQQLRWVGLAAVLAGVGLLVVVAGMLIDSPLLYIGGAVAYMAVLPLVIGAAVLRYRLYDLDRIISRTIAYGLLTILLGLGYAAVVLSLGQVLGREGSNLAVAAATLAAAAAFQPARRRIQTLVDRRFNRRRYDAARTIVAFSDRLRQQIDLDALRSELLMVVDQTMQPTRAALWLRSPADRRTS